MHLRHVSVEAEIRNRIRSIDAIARLPTIPAIDVLTATTLYAWIGDVHRFPSAKVLSVYAGLVPSVRQCGASQLHAVAQRVYGRRGRRKIAAVALARHLLRIACYVLREGTSYQADRIGAAATHERAVA